MTIATLPQLVGVFRAISGTRAMAASEQWNFVALRHGSIGVFPSINASS